MNQESIRIGTLVQASPTTADYIRQILPHGFESFSITFGGAIEESIDLERLAREVRETLQGTGAVISSIGIYGNPLTNETTRRDFAKLIDAASFFGCSIIGAFTGRITGKSIDESLPRFGEVFTPLAKQAADKGIKIAFENCDMGGDWHRGDWNIAQNPTAWEKIFNEVPMENLGLEWEPCHQMVSLIDPMPQLRKWIGKIYHLHGKDATIYWDVIREHGIDSPHQFAYHRTPGFGDSNWTDIISELRRGGFTGSIDIEGWHDPIYSGDLEMTGQVHALNYLKNCRTAYIPNPK